MDRPRDGAPDAAEVGGERFDGGLTDLAVSPAGSWCRPEYECFPLLGIMVRRGAAFWKWPAEAPGDGTSQGRLGGRCTCGRSAPWMSED